MAKPNVYNNKIHTQNGPYVNWNQIISSTYATLRLARATHCPYSRCANQSKIGQSHNSPNSTTDSTPCSIENEHNDFPRPVAFPAHSSSNPWISGRNDHGISRRSPRMSRDRNDCRGIRHRLTAPRGSHNGGRSRVCRGWRRRRSQGRGFWHRRWVRNGSLVVCPSCAVCISLPVGVHQGPLVAPRIATPALPTRSLWITRYEGGGCTVEY